MDVYLDMSASSDRPDPFVAELMRFSSRAMASKPAKGLREILVETSPSSKADWAEMETSTVPSQESLTDDESIHAAPLPSLNERDEVALAEMFERTDADEIANDVITHLLWLWPEPCWEEELFDLLTEDL